MVDLYTRKNEFKAQYDKVISEVKIIKKLLQINRTFFIKFCMDKFNKSVGNKMHDVIQELANSGKIMIEDKEIKK